MGGSAVRTFLALALLVGCGEPDPGPHWPTAGQSGVAGSAGSAPTPESRLVPGNWAIVARNMDGTVLEVDAAGNGRGCLSGWPQDPGGLYDQCGPVVGRVDGDHVKLDLTVPWPAIHAVIEGTLSESGRRIGGVYETIDESGRHSGQPGSAVAYSRDRDPDAYPRSPAWPPELGNGWNETELVSGTGERYALTTSWTTIGGDLGEFLSAEIAFDVQSEQRVVVHAGPVASTLPDRPIRLEITVVSHNVQSVEAELPNGDTFTLAPAPR